MFSRLIAVSTAAALALAAPAALRAQTPTPSRASLGGLGPAAGSGTLNPYVLGGVGAISVHQLGADSTWSKFAGNFGAGLEYRFGRVGIRAEGRDFVYTFDRYGFDKTQHDVAWQGGLTLSF